MYHKVATLLKRWSTIDFFLKIFFLRQLIFGTYCIKKKLRWNLFIVELEFVTLLKQSQGHDFQTFAINYFRNIFICVEESVYTWKITWKSGLKPGERNDFSPFCTECSLISNFRTSELLNRSIYLVYWT